MKFSIVIPNWNGKRFLEKNLPAVLATGADEVIVVDDGSTDGSVEYLRKLQTDKVLKFKVIRNKKHSGFAKAVNRGVKQANGSIVILLNNDVFPQKDFLKPLERNFKDPKVFAVSLGESQWSWARGKWVKGFVEHEPGLRTAKAHISFWASGGSTAFRKSIWEKLGGFDEIYSPFYWEDIDLSYRAWKRGYQVWWEPKAIVYHQHQGTIKQFPKSEVRLISERNQLLFIWKNITDRRMFQEHLLGLFSRLRRPGYVKVVLRAVAKVPQIIPRRLREKREASVNDRAIFKMFEGRD